MSPRVFTAYYTPFSNLVDFLPLSMPFCAFGAKWNGTGKNDFLGDVLDKNGRTRYSKTTIYRAYLGKEIRPGKSRSTVYRGIFYTDLHIKLVFGG